MKENKKNKARQEGKPEEREFLAHWVNVVDYE